MMIFVILALDSEIAKHFSYLFHNFKKKDRHKGDP